MPTSTFSSAVICGKRRMFWNVRPMPAFVIACGGLPVTSSPSKRMRPAVGLYRPVSMLKNVVLPAPFGPIRLTIARSGMVKSRSFTARRPPNSLRTSRASSEVPGLVLAHPRASSAPRSPAPGSSAPRIS